MNLEEGREVQLYQKY